MECSQDAIRKDGVHAHSFHENQPVSCNVHQHDRVVKRRLYKAEAAITTMQMGKNGEAHFLDRSSRSQHAERRARGPQGRFV
mmetsp:Transcript_31458/g.52054  ORF Transcript_31458/g.52054 Transcript_31458/m.52054 type:complete len:82 (-) Transcript_31458:50-295(-)